jgi:tRNA U34 5-carboxymethylaminomethyl modifying GTPase MnmE/TrmE
MMWDFPPRAAAPAAAGGDNPIQAALDNAEQYKAYNRAFMAVVHAGKMQYLGLNKSAYSLETCGIPESGDVALGAVFVQSARHREALEEAEAALRRSLAASLPELRAEDLRLAWRSLGHITGRVDVEDLLDVIFADFCLGK